MTSAMKMYGYAATRALRHILGLDAKVSNQHHYAKNGKIGSIRYFV